MVRQFFYTIGWIIPKAAASYRLSNKPLKKPPPTTKRPLSLPSCLHNSTFPSAPCSVNCLEMSINKLHPAHGGHLVHQRGLEVLGDSKKSPFLNAVVNFSPCFPPFQDNCPRSDSPQKLAG